MKLFWASLVPGGALGFVIAARVALKVQKFHFKVSRLTGCVSAHFYDAFAFSGDFSVVEGTNAYCYFYGGHDGGGFEVLVLKKKENTVK